MTENKNFPIEGMHQDTVIQIIVSGGMSDEAIQKTMEHFGKRPKVRKVSIDRFQPEFGDPVSCYQP